MNVDEFVVVAIDEIPIDVQDVGEAAGEAGAEVHPRPAEHHDDAKLIEQAVQTLGQLKYVESRSSRGISSVKAVIKDQYDKDTLPQVWDELRRKVGDAAQAGKLPPGAGPSIVNDDFGDVYGIFFALTGDGYSYKELEDVAKYLQRELLLSGGGFPELKPLGSVLSSLQESLWHTQRRTGRTVNAEEHACQKQTSKAGQACHTR